MKHKMVTLMFAFLSIGTYAQTNIKQSDLLDFNIGKNMEKYEPQNIRYKDGKSLAPGKYVVVMDEEGRRSEGLKSAFEVNNLGKIEGEMNFEMPDKSFALKAVYKNDILIQVDKRKNGKLVESNYFDKGIFYEKGFEPNGDFKSESRSKDGKVIYSKRMNLSGWDIQDEIKGTRTFYYGKTDTMESRITDKNLEKGIDLMEEKFDEKGTLIRKEIKYTDGKKKTINQDGSYELVTPTDAGDKVSEYTSKGKLIKTYVASYPTISIQ